MLLRCQHATQVLRPTKPLTFAHVHASRLIHIHPDLKPPTDWWSTYLPVLVSRSKTGKQGKFRVDPAGLKRLMGEQESESALGDFAYRFRETGLSRLFDKSDAIDGPVRMRVACFWACGGKETIEDQIAARKVCAASRDPRFQPICHSLKGQALVLYVLGYLELERPESEFRMFAWYMLSIAAGLGQLDAALLLHQLHKVDPRFVPGPESRDLIARAAGQRLDWRAMVAHCEHTLDRLGLRRNANQAGYLEFEQCLEMLVEAMRLAKPTKEPKVIQQAPPKGVIDAKALMIFKPPHEVILELAADDALALKPSDQTREHFRSAAEVGAKLYNDGKAAWYHAQSESKHSDEWIQHTELAASSGIPEAAFELAKHHLQKDGWYPSVTARVLEEADRQDLEYYRQSESVLEAKTVSAAEKHNQILALRNKELLDRQEGLYWMKIAAELHADTPVKALNRYLIAAGLLRQNGLLKEGYDMLLDGAERLRDTLGDARIETAVLTRIAEYLEKWDTTMAHELLHPDQIDHLLDQ